MGVTSSCLGPSTRPSPAVPGSSTWPRFVHLSCSSGSRRARAKERERHTHLHAGQWVTRAALRPAATACPPWPPHAGARQLGRRGRPAERIRYGRACEWWLRVDSSRWSQYAVSRGHVAACRRPREGHIRWRHRGDAGCRRLRIAFPIVSLGVAHTSGRSAGRRTFWTR